MTSSNKKLKYDILYEARKCDLIKVPLFLVCGDISSCIDFSLFLQDYITGDTDTRRGIKYIMHENLRRLYISSGMGNFINYIFMVELCTPEEVPTDTTVLLEYENVIRAWIFDCAMGDKTASIKFKYLCKFLLSKKQKLEEEELTLKRHNACTTNELIAMNTVNRDHNPTITENTFC